jgi:hypothetical protein
MIAAVFEFIAEERCQQRCVDKAGGDEVDADGRELLHTHAAQSRSVIRSISLRKSRLAFPRFSATAHTWFIPKSKRRQSRRSTPNGPIRGPWSPAYPVLSLDYSGKIKPLISTPGIYVPPAFSAFASATSLR